MRLESAREEIVSETSRRVEQGRRINSKTENLLRFSEGEENSSWAKPRRMRSVEEIALLSQSHQRLPRSETFDAHHRSNDANEIRFVFCTN
jgi:hypothetical protein